MQQDLQWLAVRRQDDKLGLTAIESFCRLVGPLPQLPVVRGLLNQVQDLGRQSLLGQGISLGVHLLSHDVLLYFLSALLA